MLCLTQHDLRVGQVQVSMFRRFAPRVQLALKLREELEGRGGSRPFDPKQSLNRFGMLRALQQSFQKRHGAPGDSRLRLSPREGHEVSDLARDNRARLHEAKVFVLRALILSASDF